MNIVEWLESIGATNVKLIGLKIEGKTWYGAEYMQDGETRLYLIGERPTVAKRGNCYFTLQQDWAQWYIACYYEGDNAAMHPFGSNFVLKKWDSPEAIDGKEFYTQIQVQLLREV